MRFEYLTIGRRIMIMSFKSGIDMNHALIRFSEWRENPTHAKAVVSKQVLIDTYLDTLDKDYRDMIGGHNIWGESVKEMIASNQYVFEDTETELIDLWFKNLDMDLPCMIIGVEKWAPDILRHELAHAMFMLHESYRTEILTVCGALPPEDIEDIRKALIKLGYGEAVIQDEMQAYLIDDPGFIITTLGAKPNVVRTKRWTKTQKELKTIFYKYLSKHTYLNLE